MVASAATHIPIEGDANIAKYICRSCCGAQFYPDDLMTSITVDSTLEAANKLDGRKRNDNLVLKPLNAGMGKSEFVCGATETVADFVLYAAITGKKVAAPSNLKKWAKKMASEPVYDTDAFTTYEKAA